MSGPADMPRRPLCFSCRGLFSKNMKSIRNTAPRSRALCSVARPAPPYVDSTPSLYWIILVDRESTHNPQRNREWYHHSPGRRS